MSVATPPPPITRKTGFAVSAVLFNEGWETDPKAVEILEGDARDRKERAIREMTADGRDYVVTFVGERKRQREDERWTIETFTSVVLRDPRDAEPGEYAALPPLTGGEDWEHITDAWGFLVDLWKRLA